MLIQSRETSRYSSPFFRFHAFARIFEPSHSHVDSVRHALASVNSHISDRPSPALSHCTDCHAASPSRGSRASPSSLPARTRPLSKQSSLPSAPAWSCPGSGSFLARPPKPRLLVSRCSPCVWRVSLPPRRSSCCCRSSRLGTWGLVGTFISSIGIKEWGCSTYRYGGSHWEQSHRGFGRGSRLLASHGPAGCRQHKQCRAPWPCQ